MGCAFANDTLVKTAKYLGKAGKQTAKAGVEVVKRVTRSGVKSATDIVGSAVGKKVVKEVAEQTSKKVVKEVSSEVAERTAKSLDLKYPLNLQFFASKKVNTTISKNVDNIPTSLLKGKANTRVYYGIRDGKINYVGITKDVQKCQIRHGKRFDYLTEITTESLTRRQARAIEQTIIELNPNFSNKINSISNKRDWYNDAINWGTKWLKANEIIK